MYIEVASNYLSKEDWEYEFVGREAELRELCVHLEKSRLICIFGRRYLGKSRLAREVYNRVSKTCKIPFRFDKVEDQLSCFADLLKFWQKLYEEVGFNYPFETPQWAACKGDKSPPFGTDEEQKVRSHFLSTLVKEDVRVFIMLDNIDTAWRDDRKLKDTFLELINSFIKQSGSRIQILITSGEVLRFQDLKRNKVMFEYELPPMNLEDSEQFLTKVVDDRLELGAYTRPIAQLCAGVPMLIMMAGSQLTDECFEPHEFLYLTVENRVKAMSPDYAPPTDRMDINIKELHRFGEDSLGFSFYNWFHALAKDTSGYGFGINEAMAAYGSKSSAKTKQERLVPFLHKYVIKMESGSKNTFAIDEVIRDAMHQIQILSQVPEQEIQQLALNHLRRHLKMIQLSDLSADKLIEFVNHPEMLENELKKIYGPADGSDNEEPNTRPDSQRKLIKEKKMYRVRN